RQLNRPPFRGAPLRACRGASARRGLREKSHLLTCATKSCPTRPPPAIPHRTSSNKTTAKAPQDPPLLRCSASPPCRNRRRHLTQPRIERFWTAIFPHRKIERPESMPVPAAQPSQFHAIGPR